MHKFNAHVFHRTMQNVKRHLGAGYQHIKNVAGHIDHGVHIAKQVYSGAVAAAPYIEALMLAGL